MEWPPIIHSAAVTHHSARQFFNLSATLAGLSAPNQAISWYVNQTIGRGKKEGNTSGELNPITLS